MAEKDLRNIESTNHEVFADSRDSGEDVFNVLDSTSISVTDTLEKLKKSDGKHVSIAGVRIDVPKKAVEDITAALDRVSSHFQVDASNVFFEKLPDKIVGKALKDKILLDPWILLHPGLVEALGHEHAHDGGDIPFEGLVMEYTRVIGLTEGAKTENTAKYHEALVDFQEFVRRINTVGSDKEIVIGIYALCKEKRYEDLYKIYKESYVDKQGDSGKKDEAERFFWKVFPELEYDETGTTVGSVKEKNSADDASGVMAA